MNSGRRKFLQTLPLLTAFGSLQSAEATTKPLLKENSFYMATNQYPWQTFYQREGRDWPGNPDACLKEVADAGFQGYEPLVNNVEELTSLHPYLKKYNLEIRSLYVNSTLHKENESERNLQNIIKIAEVAKKLNTKIFVTNPSPIQWGGTQDKSDRELEIQAGNLNTLGAALKNLGITLAYHNHDIEMRKSAREFHHMLLATEPKNVSLCLDSHWVYRGSGNSQIALFDIIKLYGHRIVELHLRQSSNGVWDEVFGLGDIDYQKLAEVLQDLKVRPHLVMEQCVEDQSPKTLKALPAHIQSFRNGRNVFVKLAE